MSKKLSQNASGKEAVKRASALKGKQPFPHELVEEVLMPKNIVSAAVSLVLNAQACAVGCRAHRAALENVACDAAGEDVGDNAWRRAYR